MDQYKSEQQQQQQQVIDKLENLTLNNVDITPSFTVSNPNVSAAASSYINNDDHVSGLSASLEISMDGVDVTGAGSGSGVTSENWFDTIAKYRDNSHDLLMAALHPQYDLAQYYDTNNMLANKVAAPHTLDQSVLFASYALPNRMEMLNNSQLPMGLLLSPFDRPVLTPKSTDFYPPSCSKCHAYINIYCKLEKKQSQSSQSASSSSSSISLHGNPYWICAVCRHSNPIDSGTKGVRSIWEVKQGLGWWATDHFQTVLQSDHYDIKKRKKFNTTITTTVPTDPISSPQHNESDSISTVIDNGSGSVVTDVNTATTTASTVAPNSPQSFAKHPNIVSLYEMSSSSNLFSAAKVIYGAQEKDVSRIDSSGWLAKVSTELPIAHGDGRSVCIVVGSLGVVAWRRNRVCSDTGERIHCKQWTYLCVPTSGTKLWTGFDPDSGIYSRLDIHCPEQVNLTHLIGPTTKVNEQQLFISDIENKSTSGFCSVSVELTNMQQDVALSIFFELQEDIPQDYLYFQFVVHLLDHSENRILRVITKRIKTTGNFNRFIDSLDLNVCSVLFSKKLILDSIKSSSSNSDQDEYFNFYDRFDKQLKSISQKCSNIEKGWFRNTVTIPDTIKQFIKKMYLVREGVLFGSIIQNNDDFEVLSSLFINTNFTDSMRIMLPKLIQSDQSEQLIEISPKIDSLTNDRVLIYDAQTHIYLFIGSSISHDSSAVMNARSFIENQIIHRVPLPYIITFNENEHDIRWLKARLQDGNMEDEKYYQTITK
ncbi:hypothetical protein PPL_08776 [Heterostelium album PN500]|uniref:Protein transport protein SEC23 n=1 Tax=Heterostelium pallidum (strain ATCC 26659 / Pp 5 / PN500) TaxID=670386 RepID=D3BJP7_HETP5|nr:hypothetical protein PPL_08776 [Heterostelium album PN500]EFA78127.1 hypothetical protein PPL_08776 [Heterostelium album PN500]|eukprot:XP_020430253.1 hypothetical protein PPL_08776 [Heterostelium album PN500]